MSREDGRASSEGTSLPEPALVSHLGDGGAVTDKVVEPAKRATVCIKLTT
jgi:hypothetical protein